MSGILRLACEVCGRPPALIMPATHGPQHCVGNCGNPASHISELHDFAVQLEMSQETMGPAAAEEIRRTLHEAGRAFGVEICPVCFAPAGTPPASAICLWPQHARIA